MNEDSPAPAIETVAAVERLVAAAVGGAVHVESAALLARRRSLVWRLRLTDAGDFASVIVKQARRDSPRPYGPDAGDPDGPASLLFNEWAALAFLNGIPRLRGLTPRFLGGDREYGLLVSEDLGDGVSLADLLLGPDPMAAVSGLEAYAVTLGRIHAATAGRFSGFRQLRRGLGPATGRSLFASDREQLVGAFAQFAALAAQFALDAPAALHAEGEAVAALLNEPGEFDAFSPSDACPDNNRYREGRLTLFDFEGAGFAHALLDAAYLRLALPTCWCVARLPDELPGRLEALYRSAVVRGCPAAADGETFRSAMLAACAAWLVWATNRMVPRLREQDVVSGPATGRRQVISRLRMFAAMATDAGRIECLGGLADRFAAALERAWPAEATGLPLYPAFAGKTPHAE